ncbi:MAG TPA: type III secretion system export apparatus subunit SctS [Alphaproteobacteria bacterium]|nr:type III secretion system export apparatus subunit SctS [Alphaproteobacteria bacterium]
MDQATIAHLLSESLMLVLLLSLPALLIAAVVGLTVGLLQAVTQIQDQTLPMAIKVIAVVLSLVFLGPLLGGPLVRHADRVFAEFPELTRSTVAPPAGE